ncbi:MAG TPA: hypothetical protein VGM90_14825 [Kofleriaceae bacterium]|jgi:hypothetical protein
MRLQLLGVLGLLGGCAGVYAEVAASTVSTGSIAPSGGGTSVDVGGSTVGFNLGVELGNVRKRFSMGYASDSLSFDGGSGTLTGGASRFDFNIVSLMERLKLRIALGFDFAGGSSSYAGMKKSDGGGFTGFGGLDATYFLTWKNAIHVAAGAQFIAQSVPGGDYSGVGVSVRATISHTFGDVRPDQTVVIPLETNRDLIGAIELGSKAVGCATEGQTHGDTAATLTVSCPGQHHLEYFQIAEGILLTCVHEDSEDSCRAINSKIIQAAAAEVKAAAQPEPAPTPVVPVEVPAAEATPAP